MLAVPVSTKLVTEPLTLTLPVPVADSAPADTLRVRLSVSSNAEFPSSRLALVNSSAEDWPAVICSVLGKLWMTGETTDPVDPISIKFDCAVVAARTVVPFRR